MFANGGNFFAWGFLVLFAILLIVAGVQGSAGRLLAVALVPAELDVVGGSGGGSNPCNPPCTGASCILPSGQIGACINGCCVVIPGAPIL